MSINRVNISGHLTRDPELRTLPSGVSVCTFTIAINRKFVNQQGVREADFLNIVAWRRVHHIRHACRGRGPYRSKGYEGQH